MPPHPPFAMSAGTVSVGWFAGTRTGFLRGLRDCSASAGRDRRDHLPCSEWSVAPVSFLNLTYATPRPLIGLAYAQRSKVLISATDHRLALWFLDCWMSKSFIFAVNQPVSVI